MMRVPAKVWKSGFDLTNAGQSRQCFIEGCEGYQLREGAVHYKALFEAENDDIGPENTYFWDIKAE